MFVAHCGNCFETPCVCPRWYANKVPTVYELDKLTGAQLAELQINLATVTAARLRPHSRASNNTVVHTSTHSNVRPTVGDVTTLRMED